ncbi:hypothetical protein CFI98_08875 [Lactiplantibacillus plantarum]|nr:hypothetical protein CFM86_07980 [Lactiplantibacillus plantarum]AYG34909.1 hypothetical protein CFI98_08875 [Lactiplantibacillus plantarum]
MPPVMFSVVTKYHKGRHSLFLYNSEIFYAFTQDILRSRQFPVISKMLLIFFTCQGGVGGHTF